MEKLTGQEAIDYKIENPEAQLNKYNDPIECELYDITVEQAEDIAREDPSLIWVDVD